VSYQELSQQFCTVNSVVNVIMRSIMYHKPSASDWHYVTASRWAQNWGQEVQRNHYSFYNSEAVQSLFLSHCRSIKSLFFCAKCSHVRYSDTGEHYEMRQYTYTWAYKYLSLHNIMATNKNSYSTIIYTAEI